MGALLVNSLSYNNLHCSYFRDVRHTGRAHVALQEIVKLGGIQHAIYVPTSLCEELVQLFIVHLDLFATKLYT